MKKLLIASAMFLAVSFTTNTAQAQVTNAPDVIAAAGNLINVQIGDVTVNLNDITVQDVVDVTNVLNGNDVRVLTDILNGLTIDNVLNNALRDADIIKNNQVVVGVIVNALGEVTEILVAKQGQLRK